MVGMYANEWVMSLLAIIYVEMIIDGNSYGGRFHCTANTQLDRLDQLLRIFVLSHLFHVLNNCILSTPNNHDIFRTSTK